MHSTRHRLEIVLDQGLRINLRHVALIAEVSAGAGLVEFLTKSVDEMWSAHLSRLGLVFAVLLHMACDALVLGEIDLVAINGVRHRGG